MRATCARIRGAVSGAAADEGIGVDGDVARETHPLADAIVAVLHHGDGEVAAELVHENVAQYVELCDQVGRGKMGGTGRGQVVPVNQYSVLADWR